MFQIDDDMTIYITRGDVAYFTVTAENNGEKYMFQPGDVVRIKVTAKKDASNVAFQKDFPVLEESEKVDILLTEKETKIGDVISKPVDYWYEIELNPYTNPQTIIGYDEDGAKIFKLFPEGRDLGTTVAEEDVAVMDSELSLTSQKPVENQAITRAMIRLGEAVKSEVENHAEALAKVEAEAEAAVNLAYEETEKVRSELAIERARITNLATLTNGSTTGDAELADIRTGEDGTVYANAGESVRTQFANVKSDLSEVESIVYKYSDLATIGGVNRKILINDGTVDGTSGSVMISIYPVTDGERLYLKLFNVGNNRGVYQFQKSATLFPYGTPNTDLIGETVEGDFEDIVTVPSEATYLIVCKQMESTLEKIQTVTNNISSVSTSPSKLCRNALHLGGKKIKLIGDSITAGFGGTGYDVTANGGGAYIFNDVYSNVNGVCWANMLKSYWESKFNCTVTNFGYTGITSTVMLLRINDLVKADDDVVICMVGTNDRGDLSVLGSNLTGIVNNVRSRGKDIILMASIPASVTNETGKPYHMEDVEHCIANVADSFNMEYISVFKLMNEYCGSRGITIDSLLSDGLHPNDEGYKAMFYIISNALGVATKVEGATW